MRLRILSSVFVCCLAASASAQSNDPGAPAIATRVAAAIQDLRARFGPRWSAQIDPVTGYAELVYGGRAEWQGQPITDQDWIARAEVAIEATRGVHGVDVGTLIADRVVLLPLGQVGSSDKWSVDLHQEIGGLRVHDGTVVALFDASGALLSIQNHALANLDAISLVPAITREAARDQAVLAFEKQYAPKIASISEPKLVILPMDEARARVGHLAWEIEIQSAQNGGDPVGRRFWVDARFGYPLKDEQSIHFFDISGTVSTMATPGTQADSATNPETAQPAKYLRIQHATGTVFTDVNGNFTIPGATTTQNVTLSYVGTYGDVDDQPTATHYTQTVTLNPGPGNAVLLNPTAIDTVTAQANIFNHVSTERDYVRRTNPTDATADRLFTGHANIAATCNAYYDGAAINFYAAGGNCNNTAFSTVIAHEQGHWLNDLYGTGNGGDGMGEGNADVFALYVFDTPLNGQGFFTNGGAVRSGNNTRAFCGDCSPGCYGEVHADGEPWMGAAWKVRTQLDNSLGNTLGDQVADQLFLGWMNGFNQTQIRSVIELQWLLLDDNDANLTNGTPHATAIKAGFRQQGFPGYEIEFGSVSSLADAACESGSYPVSANVHTVQGTTITSVTLSYRVGAGPLLNVPMSPTGGDGWSASIPFVLSPATVEYSVQALDSAGNTKPGFCGTRSFFIGQVVSFAADDFESAGAWTHGTVGDTTNANDDWQRGVPRGLSGTSQSVSWVDPAVAAHGTSCWGNDLGITATGAGNGAYQSNVHNFLRSPAFNCSGQAGVRLIFKRWLSVEKSQYDVARVLVNNVEVWRNPYATDIVDTSWSIQSIDIASIADNNPSVTLQFELQSDGGLELGGWQIDDLSFGRIVRAPQCSPIQNFCAGDGSLATACPCGNFGATGHGCADANSPQGGLLTASGTTNPDTVVLSSSSLPPNAAGIYLQQDGLGEHLFQNGVMCANGNLIRLRQRNAVGGASTFPDATDTVNLSTRGLVVPGSGARRYYSLWYRGAVPGFCTLAAANITNGVMITW
jgi:hypothetical protein